MNESWSRDYHILTLTERDGRAGAAVVGGIGDVEYKESKKTALSPFLEKDLVWGLGFLVFFFLPSLCQFSVDERDSLWDRWAVV